MTGEFWSVRLTSGYSSDVARLAKRHYRKNAKAAAEYASLLEDLARALELNPLAEHFGAPPVKLAKPYPNRHAVEGALFRNARFKMPSLHGAAQAGRVYFDVHLAHRVVRVLGAYTHADHPSDLGDRQLIDRLRQAPLFEE